MKKNMDEEKERNRLEEDGLYLADLEHWEFVENFQLHSYHYKVKEYTKTKDEIKERIVNHHSCSICIPMQLMRHLGLKDKDRIDVAVRRHKE